MTRVSRSRVPGAAELRGGCRGWLCVALAGTLAGLDRIRAIAKKSGPRSRGRIHVIVHVEIRFLISGVDAPQQTELMLQPTGGVMPALPAGVTSPLRELLLAGSRPLWNLRTTDEPIRAGTSADYQLLESSPCPESSAVGHVFPPCVKIKLPRSLRSSRKETIFSFYVHIFRKQQRVAT